VLNQYTTFEDVRAALGVSDNELEDTVLTLKLYEDHLMSDLDDISVNLRSTFVSFSNDPAPTDAMSRLLQYARLFATYSVAKALTNTLPLFAPRAIEDGKARFQRFESPYKDTIKSVEREYERWRNRLLAAFTALGETDTRTARSYMTVVSPIYDPVTGQ
jgi:hypothetical protein